MKWYHWGDRLKRTLVSLVVGAMFCLALHPGSLTLAQTPAEKSVPPTAVPADVASIEAVIKAAFDVMSGPAGKKRDWNRFRSLFKPSAQLIVAPRRQDGSGINFRVQNLDEYIESSSQWLEKHSLSEFEVHRITEQFGHLAHAFSTYESREKPEDPQPSSRGVSSFQLVHDGKRWWIVNWFWLGERPDNPIPKRYLPQ